MAEMTSIRVVLVMSAENIPSVSGSLTSANSTPEEGEGGSFVSVKAYMPEVEDGGATQTYFFPTTWAVLAVSSCAQDCTRQRPTVAIVVRIRMRRTDSAFRT